MANSPHAYSRRRFLRQAFGAGALAVAGGASLFAQSPAQVEALRFAFLTDIHLMKDCALRSAQGLAACLAAVEKLDPRPEFILVGGDLVNRCRDLTIDEAERRYDFFLKVWNDNTGLPAHWTFGNHDLIGTSNPAVPPGGPHYGKGLFKDRFKLKDLYYNFDCKGWHFVVLDDIALQPDRNYLGEFFDDELAFLSSDLDIRRGRPIILCAHIPAFSNLPLWLALAHDVSGQTGDLPKTLVCTNGGKLLARFPGHDVKAVLAGHMHFHEEIQMEGIKFINSGAVCGSYWKGPFMDCPEGFGVVDLSANGSVAFEYRKFGWKAT